ncbi:type II CAAX prenyl endopeptidase Rce1 family protein [Lysobacter koreensis]|uniref:Type II CAAX prenyl endopeptidase Rce1 family protein n=1 Tax=Lysobacter koreensis TaxID=266122 RepID=A0ABW2YJI6_9GAMM
MKQLLRDRDGSLRNGWWVLAFLALFLASQPVYRVVSKALQLQGVDGPWLGPLPVVFLLLVTWASLRLRREPLAAVGLQLDRNWARELLLGAGLGMALIALVTGLIVASGGVAFSLDPARSLGALVMGAWVFVWVALLEELLFRGFVFQRLVDGIGAWPALLAMALLLAIGHWSNPGMEGATRAWASVDTALGAVLFGLAYLRTGSLAMPIGMHFGWNWAQGAVLGFDVSGLDQAGWLLPEMLGKPQWLTGVAFGPEASVLAVLVDGAAIVLMWRWKGTAPARSMVLAPAV